MRRKIIIGVLVVCLLAFVAVFAFAQNSPNIAASDRTYEVFQMANIYVLIWNTKTGTYRILNTSSPNNSTANW